MKTINMLFILLAALGMAVLPAWASPDTDFHHQPWTNLEPAQKEADTVSDEHGTTVTQKTTDQEKQGNTTVTTTVTKTHRINKDGSETDRTETVKKTESIAVSGDGQEYVKERKTDTLVTEREVGSDKSFTKKTVHSAGTQTFGEPGEFGRPADHAGTVTHEPTVTKMTDKKGNEVVRYTGENGTDYEWVTHPDGSTTSTTGSGGHYVQTHESKDGSTMVTVYRGKNPDGTRRVESVTQYDRDHELMESLEYGKDGRSTRKQYPWEKKDEWGKIRSVETDYFQDGSIVERRVYYENGESYIINYIGNHPTSKDYFDENGNRYEHEVIPMEEWDNPEYAAAGMGVDTFADHVGFAARPGNSGRDIGVSVFSGQPASREHDEHPGD